MNEFHFDMKALQEKLSGKVLQPQRTVSGWEKNRLEYRNTICTDKDIDLSEFKIVGYLMGNHIHVNKSINWSHFDTVTFISKSPNTVDGKVFHHFYGYRHTGIDGKARISTIIAEKIIKL